MEIKDKIKLIADAYGYDAQSRQCIEEMAELTQAINKFWRKNLNCGKNSIPDEYSRKEPLLVYENLIEEIADVQIMLWQMAYLLNADASHVIEQKLGRQLERIKSEGNKT